MLAGHVHGYQAERDAALCGYIEAAMRKIPCWRQDLRLSTVVLCQAPTSVTQSILFLPLMEQEQFCQWRYLRVTFGVTMSFASCCKTMCCEQCHVPLTPGGNRNSELLCTWALVCCVWSGFESCADFPILLVSVVGCRGSLLFFCQVNYAGIKHAVV